ncbi:MAG: hypothetical protein EPO39_15220 [Candidatus Manganitrophaceae bacterium]|nr:MAG: hypothetical protein EPO39_15220 [Candidatus Manganitrophaceae bacterium]
MKDRSSACEETFAALPWGKVYRFWYQNHRLSVKQNTLPSREMSKKSAVDFTPMRFSDEAGGSGLGFLPIVYKPVAFPISFGYNSMNSLGEWNHVGTEDDGAEDPSST